MTAAAAIAAGIVGAVALPATAADHDHDHGRRHAEVVISDVQHVSPDRETRSNRSLNREWVEITNNSRRTVNLDGWTLADREGHTYTFHHYRLDGRSTVRVHTGMGRDTRTDLYQDRRMYVWDRFADTATLRNDHGRFVDDASWGRHHRDEDRGEHRGDHRDGDRGEHRGDHRDGDRDGHRDGDRDGDRH
ncbi:lamin tail domain-containing protein [Streptomyces sp. NPDC050534]|uniref:lamin tail domain-containing protein n=1 Tax=Streptomyces sp. NPDC050534 TaxID=3365625 RepID=UPI0037B46CF4